MPTPTLVLSFDGTLEGQTRDGPYTPTETGAVVYADGLVEGTKAYVSNLSPAAYLTVDPTLIDHTRGTIAVRYWFESGSSQYAIGASTATGERLYLRRLNGRLYASLNALDNIPGPANHPDQTWTTMALVWNGGAGRFLVDGVEVGTVSATALPSAITTFRIGAPPSTTNPTSGRCAGVLVYDIPLTNSELAPVFDTEQQWTFNMLAPSTTAPRPSRVFVPGSPHNIGPLHHP